MNSVSVLQWIKNHLGPIIRQALSARPGTIYTEDWLAAMAYRETGFLLHRYIPRKYSFEKISELMHGDYCQRKGETKKSYHGYSFWQIDTGSYPDFISSGDWKDPLKSCIKAIDVLEEKRKYLLTRCRLKGDELNRAITAAYNCGQGNVIKAVNKKLPIDYYTFNRDYSQQVWLFRKEYSVLKETGVEVNR